MRLWSLHPRYLDPQGLVALWREALLAQAVLLGLTRGYRSHPQLNRFLAAPSPPGAIGTYLRHVHDEATRRGYSFDGAKIVVRGGRRQRLAVTTGQLACEWDHLQAKLRVRSPAWVAHDPLQRIEPHPMFAAREGPVEEWERRAAPPA